MKQEPHYDITGQQVDVQEPEEDKVDNRDYITAVIIVLIGIGVAALIISSLIRD